MDLASIQLADTINVQFVFAWIEIVLKKSITNSKEGKKENKMNLKRGTQIIYVPAQARKSGGGTLNHPDCERGFVTSSISLVAFCRYWSKNSEGELRTRVNSEATKISNLIICDTVPQNRVEVALKRWCTK